MKATTYPLCSDGCQPRKNMKHTGPAQVTLTQWRVSISLYNYMTIYDGSSDVDSDRLQVIKRNKPPFSLAKAYCYWDVQQRELHRRRLWPDPPLYTTETNERDACSSLPLQPQSSMSVARPLKEGVWSVCVLSFLGGGGGGGKITVGGEICWNW